MAMDPWNRGFKRIRIVYFMAISKFINFGPNLKNPPNSSFFFGRTFGRSLIKIVNSFTGGIGQENMSGADFFWYLQSTSNHFFWIRNESHTPKCAQIMVFLDEKITKWKNIWIKMNFNVCPNVFWCFVVICVTTSSEIVRIWQSSAINFVFSQILCQIRNLILFSDRKIYLY